MKQVVVNEQLDEVEVHPPGFYERLVDICVSSARDLLAQADRFNETACPACASAERIPAFEKHDYKYWSCQNCATLYVSPRPSRAQLDYYLLDSPVAAFRDSNEYRQIMTNRTKDLVAYRADWSSELCARNRCNNHQPLIDIETRTPDYLALLRRWQGNPLISVKPLGALTTSWNEPIDGVTVADNLADLAGVEARLITAFDVLEHEVNPLALMQAAHAALAAGGLLVITTRSGSGFDIQILWEHATVFPVEHINLISVEGIRTLLGLTGFEIVEESTPGQLDVQMIERIIREQPEIELPRFLGYFLRHRDRYAKRRLQQFLQENLLSSYLRIVARKVNRSS